MTVTELIAALQALPQDARVVIYRIGEAMCNEDLDPKEPELNSEGCVEL